MPDMNVKFDPSSRRRHTLTERKSRMRRSELPCSQLLLTDGVSRLGLVAKMAQLDSEGLLRQR